jgi:hypothetical protein
VFTAKNNFGRAESEKNLSKVLVSGMMKAKNSPQRCFWYINGIKYSSDVMKVKSVHD